MLQQFLFYLHMKIYLLALYKA